MRSDTEMQMAAVTVLTTLNSLNEKILNDPKIPELMRKEFGRNSASMVLEVLPKQVGTFAHTQYPVVTDTRYQGETWNEAQATNWANGIQNGSSEQQREFSNK